MNKLILTEEERVHVKSLHGLLEQDIFWPTPDGEESIRTTAKENKPEDPTKTFRVKNWFKAEEILWDNEIDYDHFIKGTEGVSFTMGGNVVGFYNYKTKTLTVY